MGEEKVARLGAEFAPDFQRLAGQVHFNNAMGAAVGDEKGVLRCDEKAEGCKAAESAEKFAVLIEDLDAVSFAVADEDVAFGIEANRVGEIELALAGSFFAPGEEKFAVFVELHHAR